MRKLKVKNQIVARGVPIDTRATKIVTWGQRLQKTIFDENRHKKKTFYKTNGF